MNQPCLNQFSCSAKHRDYRRLFTSSIPGERYEFRRCGRCGLIYHDPQPTEADLRSHYTEYGLYSDPAYFAEEMQKRKASYLRSAARIAQYLKSRHAKTLEVGCSNGVMLKYFSDYGYDCYGVEVDPASSRLAKELLGEGRVFTGSLSESPFLDQSFDVVLCVQTIEHVPDPFALLTQMCATLKIGGILYISTPNFGGPSFRLLRDRWKNTAPGDHVSMFTSDTLEHFLKCAGFSIVSRQVGGLEYNQRRDANGEYTRYKSPLASALMKGIGQGLYLIRRGDGLTFVCKKEPETAGAPAHHRASA